MIRTLDAHPVITGKLNYYEYAGLSTDTKPTEHVATGSTFTEVDTGHVYFFNEETGKWGDPFNEGGE